MWGITHEGRKRESSSAACAEGSPDLWTDKVATTSFLWLIKKVSACLIVAFFLLVSPLFSSIPCWTLLAEIQIMHAIIGHTNLALAVRWLGFFFFSQIVRSIRKQLWGSYIT